jgi:hypothetical protein
MSDEEPIGTIAAASTTTSDPVAVPCHPTDN